MSYSGKYKEKFDGIMASGVIPLQGRAVTIGLEFLRIVNKFYDRVGSGETDLWANMSDWLKSEVCMDDRFDLYYIARNVRRFEVVSALELEDLMDYAVLRAWSDFRQLSAIDQEFADMVRSLSLAPNGERV